MNVFDISMYTFSGETRTSTPVISSIGRTCTVTLARPASTSTLARPARCRACGAGCDLRSPRMARICSASCASTTRSWCFLNRSTLIPYTCAARRLRSEAGQSRVPWTSPNVYEAAEPMVVAPSRSAASPISRSAAATGSSPG
ncbi:hypothetical protein [Streptosporangium sp. V21-05]|uniref:hypothetical protein n=1 Tax=Streptosporangium sp. V21-05 TaxID=3446115 RepID=UPI003F52AB48